MAKMMFVDDRPEEIFRLWQDSGCESLGHKLLFSGPFQNVASVLRDVLEAEPDIIFVGFGLGQEENGAHVMKALRATGFRGRLVANTGGDPQAFAAAGVNPDASTRRIPQEIARIAQEAV